MTHLTLTIDQVIVAAMESDRRSFLGRIDFLDRGNNRDRDYLKLILAYA